MRRVLGVAAAFALAALTACSGSGNRAALDRTTTTPPRPQYTPTYAAGPCNEEVNADARVECGTLSVPLDRAHPDKAKVVLPVAIVHPREGTPKQPDPVIYFSGGPGFSGLTTAHGFWLNGWVPDRDVILFDQRGTGEATPNLDCPEIRDPTLAALGAAAPPLDERSKLLEALRHCRTRLVDEGVDLNRYTTTDTADDVADLKRALGIMTWNLFGVSYGTTVALEMMRRHPEGVRSVVLDSVLPTTVPGDAQHQAEVVHRALRTLFDGCAVDPGCNAAYPNLDAQLDTLIADWNAAPFVADISGLDGQSHHVEITGYDTVAGLWNAMYETDLIPLLPSVIHQLPARGDFATAVVSQLANDGLHQLVGAAEGMQMSVDCADRQRLAASTDDDVIAGDPDLTSFFTLSVSGHCELWDVPSVPAAFNRAVRSDLAALVLGDEYDPITPPAQSRRVADALGDATFVQLPGLGHGAVFSGQPCPVTIFQSFLTSPGHADTSCAAGMDPPHWVLPS